MSLSSKTLILNVAPLLHHRSSHPSLLLLRIICWLLVKLGYRFCTLTDALTPGVGRSACLVIESSARIPIDSTLLATFDRLALPVTLFVATGAVAEHESDTHVLTWPMLRDRARRGWEIGVLGHEAVDLTTRSYGEQRLMIAKARAATAQFLGRAARVFAYPFGAYDATTVSCLKGEGIVAAVSAHVGANGAGTDKFQLRQLRLSGHMIATIKNILRHALAAPTPAELGAVFRSGSDRDQVRTGAAL